MQSKNNICVYIYVIRDIVCLSPYSVVLTGTGVPGPQGQKGDPGSFVPNSGYSKITSF